MCVYKGFYIYFPQMGLFLAKMFLPLEWDFAYFEISWGVSRDLLSYWTQSRVFYDLFLNICRPHVLE